MKHNLWKICIVYIHITLTNDKLYEKKSHRFDLHQIYDIQQDNIVRLLDYYLKFKQMYTIIQMSQMYVAYDVLSFSIWLERNHWILFRFVYKPVCLVSACSSFTLSSLFILIFVSFNFELLKPSGVLC
jgi:hypothetical protein